jgi:hypothetical protein
MQFGLADIHDDLALEGAGLDRAIGFAHGLERKPAKVDPWGDFPGVNQLRRLPKNCAMMLAAFASISGRPPGSAGEAAKV